MSSPISPWHARLASRLREVSPRWLAVWFVVALAALMIDLRLSLEADVDEPPAPPGVLDLRRAIGWPGTLPSEAASAVPIELPALGPLLPLDAHGRTVIRLRFDWPLGTLPDTLFAAHLGGSCGALEVQLNGTVLQRDGEPADPKARLCPRPRLIALPSTLLHERDNLLDIRLHGVRLAETVNARMAAYVSPVWIGPLHALQREQAAAETLYTGLPRLVHFGLVVLGGIVLLLSRAGHDVLLLRLYGLLILLWSVVLGLIVWVDQQWLPAAWFDVLVVGLWTPTMALAIRLLLGACGRHPSWATRWLAIQSVVVPLGLLLCPRELSFIWSTIWAVVIAIEALAAFTVYLTDRWEKRLEGVWFGFATWALVVAAWSLDSLSTPPDLPLALATAWIAGSPFGWAALAAVTGVRIVSGLNRVLIAAEASRSLLQTRILNVTSVVERNFGQLAEMRAAQMTDLERKRIASDLHDDLGAKLLTIVHTCDDERVAALAREALDEMRLAVRGLSSRPTPVGDAIADWRAEAMARMRQTKTRLEWHSHGETAEQTLSARAVVQITRILREAIGNIARHSQASRCSFVLSMRPGRLEIAIRDDGCGLPAGIEQALLAGHGLASMKQRARQLDGRCEISSVAGRGTEIRLDFPLQDERAGRLPAGSG